MIEVDLLGLTKLTHAVLPVMRDQSRGRLVNVLSLQAVVQALPDPGNNGSKFGVNGFSEPLRQEVTTHRIRTIVVEPGAVSTESTGHIRTDKQTPNRGSILRFDYTVP